LIYAKWGPLRQILTIILHYPEWENKIFGAVVFHWSFNKVFEGTFGALIRDILHFFQEKQK
jgi:hypothetical protein